MSLQEEQWRLVGHCPGCGCSVYEKDGVRAFTGPAGCNCWLPKEEEECYLP